MPARGTATVALTAQPGVAVRLRLAGRDSLALDNAAWFDVPALPARRGEIDRHVVGDPVTANSLAQALAAAPGGTLDLRTPSTYRRRDALVSNLVVLAAWVPPDGLPPAPAVVLVAPPELPGGARPSARSRRPP